MPQTILPTLPYLPPVTQLFLQNKIFPLPVSVAEAKANPELIKISQSLSPKDQPIPQHNQSILLSVQSLSVKENQGSIIKDINLNVFSGERLVIMGPNGAGKSTLLRSIVGLKKLASGSIFYQNENITT